MANTFKNAYLDVTSSAQTIYTAPASTTSIVLTLRVTNVDGAADDTITANIVDGTSGDALAYVTAFSASVTNSSGDITSISITASLSPTVRTLHITTFTKTPPILYVMTFSVAVVNKVCKGP